MAGHGFFVSVNTERETGKFVSRDEIADKLQEALSDAIDDVELSSLGNDGNSEYTVTDWSVRELDNRTNKVMWEENEQRVREELPGDAELRLKVRALTAEVRTKVEAIRALQREIEVLHEEREIGKTNVYSQEGFERPKTYIPDGPYDRVYYQFGEDDDERLAVTREANGFLEIRMDTMGVYDIAVFPRSGNVLAVGPVPREVVR